ncbi:Ig-like domain-containing protein [Klebsiella pneumoniae]|uniref:Ig-like domain-containing protein n=1 Tax=Klebsiella pneumoniae TaxID=573 RepID=UPI00388CF7B9
MAQHTAADQRRADHDATPVLSGTAEAGATVTIYDGSTVLGTAVADEDGHWRFTPDPLGEGEHPATTVDRWAGTPAATRRTLCSRWTPPWRRSAICR